MIFPAVSSGELMYLKAQRSVLKFLLSVKSLLFTTVYICFKVTGISYFLSFEVLGRC